MAEKGSSTTGRLFHMDNTRFFTYVGLVVATAIIFNRSWVMASAIGAFVSMYIGFTEYSVRDKCRIVPGDILVLVVLWFFCDHQKKDWKTFKANVHYFLAVVSRDFLRFFIL